MESRCFDAVIFDLFGTLIYNRPWGDAMNAAVAAVLGSPADGFLKEWVKRLPRRFGGVYSSVEESVEDVCRTLGIAITAEQVKRAVAIRLEYTRRNFVVKEGALELLRRLRDMGLKTSLLSNCTQEIPIVWEESPLRPLFDATVFSCEVGMAKPQREIFELACRRLATPPRRCVYVADNNDCELDVAVSCGMYAIRLLPSEGEGVPRDAERWQGPAIGSLPQLVDYLGYPAAEE